MHAAAPTSEYCPGAHDTAVAFVDPAGQAYPALQFPVQSAVINPDVLPNRPAVQGVNVVAPANEY